MDTEGVTATFICANAQTYPFEPESFDLIRVAIRRDGSSQDSVGALANLRRAAGDGGELRMIVWRGPGGQPVHDRRLGAATSVLPLTEQARARRVTRRALPALSVFFGASISSRLSKAG
jgi:hypothetical protein